MCGMLSRMTLCIQIEKFLFSQSNKALAYSKGYTASTYGLILHFLRKNTALVKLIVFFFFFQKEVQDWANILNQ